MKQKQRRYAPRTMEFDTDCLNVLQASFKTMDETFKRQTHTAHPRLPFALETYRNVKQKVKAMLDAPGTPVTLDENEILIVRTCLQVYNIDVLCMKDTPERTRLLSLCNQAAAILPKSRPMIRVHD